MSKYLGLSPVAMITCSAVTVCSDLFFFTACTIEEKRTLQTQKLTKYRTEICNNVIADTDCVQILKNNTLYGKYHPLRIFKPTKLIYYLLI